MKTSNVLHVVLAAMLSGLGQSLPLDDTTVADNNNATLEARGGCIIKGWTGNKCDGKNGHTYDYTPQENSCRSCRAFDNSHSISLSGNCERGFFRTCDNNCGSSWQSCGVTMFGGNGCIKIDTGLNFVSGQPCFEGS